MSRVVVTLTNGFGNGIQILRVTWIRFISYGFVYKKSSLRYRSSSFSTRSVIIISQIYSSLFLLSRIVKGCQVICLFFFLLCLQARLETRSEGGIYNTGILGVGSEQFSLRTIFFDEYNSALRLSLAPIFPNGSEWLHWRKNGTLVSDRTCDHRIFPTLVRRIIVDKKISNATSTESVISFDHSPLYSPLLSSPLSYRFDLRSSRNDTGPLSSSFFFPLLEAT